MMNPNSPESDIVLKWEVKYCNTLPIVKNHSSIFINGRLIIFGGYDGKENLNSLYIYQPEKNTCEDVQCFGDIPKGRNGHSSTVVSGWMGEGEMASDEIYELDCETFNWKCMSPNPSIGPSNMHTADVYKDEIFIFRGGDGIQYKNDLISYNPEVNQVSFVETSGRIPHARANHSSSVAGKCLFIFGGWSGVKRLNDMYSINLETFNWSEIEVYSSRPSARAGSTLVNNRNYLILFGGSGVGLGGNIYLNDLHFYDIKKKIWFTTDKCIGKENIPSPRAGHTSTVISDRNIYIYGGAGAGINSYDPYLYSLEIDPEPEIVLKNQAIPSKFKLKTLRSLRSLFNNQFLSDIEIFVENQKIYGHKLILSLLSEKFRNMFSVDMKESSTTKIEISKYKYIHFEVFLKYLYSGELCQSEIAASSEENNINISRDEAQSIQSSLPNKSFLTSQEFSGLSDSPSMKTQISIKSWVLLDYFELLKISDEFLVSELNSWCQVKITKLIDSNNFSIVRSFAKKYNADILLEYCNWYYNENKDDIILMDWTFSDSQSGESKSISLNYEY